MKLHLFQFLLIILSFNLGNAYFPELRADAASVDVDTLIGAIGLQKCVITCIDPLVDEIHKAMAMKNTIDNYPTLCAVFINASSCIEAAKCPGAARIYRIVTSGIENLCTRKQKYFERQHDCLKTHIDAKANYCDKKCNYVNSIAKLSKNLEVKIYAKIGGSPLPMLTKIGEICESAHCFLPCFRDAMNSVCKRSGGIIVDGLLRPFHYLAAFLDESGPVVQRMLKNSIPKTCTYLTDENILIQIRKGGKAAASSDMNSVVRMVQPNY
uniref:CPG4 domain-containing protein n=1 Tax=Panagrellus redivivus TaxID=6233 RepID=A0A7E4UTJ2_PANRE